MSVEEKQQDDENVIKSTSNKEKDATIDNSKTKPNEINQILDSESSSSESSIFDLDLVGSRICQILTPVTMCSIYVLFLIRILEWDVYYSRAGFIERAWVKLGLNYQDAEFTVSNFVNNITIVIIFILILIAISLIMLFVLYMEWHTWLSYYFYLPTIIMMSILTPIYIRGILNTQDCLSLDIITLSIFTWNFTVLGLISIFGLLNTFGPLFLQQFYLIHNSTILAVMILTTLPSWTPWLLLGILVFWDLFAVLAPFGPLKLIINMAEKVGVIEMPGLVYTTNSKHKVDVSKSKDKVNQTETGVVDRVKKSLAEQEVFDENRKIESEEKLSEQNVSKTLEEDGVNIGLGDFIFYGLLIGLTAKGRGRNDFYSTIATFNAILIGLVLTLGILAITKRPLPALPISIGLGLCTSMLTMHLVPQFMNELSTAQIFI